MFQQSRSLHTMEPMDFLMHQKMSERMLSTPQNIDASQSGAKRSRVETNHQQGGGATPGGGGGGGYDHTPVNFFPVDATSSVVMTKTEYEVMKQEVVTLKRTLNDFRGSVDAEIGMLKKENKALKKQVSSCTCVCKKGPNNRGNKASGKLSETENSHPHYGTCIDMCMCASPTYCVCASCCII